MRATPGARPGPALVRQVEDTGTGILPDVLAQIGDACDPTKQNGKDTGRATDVGVSTVRGMVAPPMASSPSRAKPPRHHLPHFPPHRRRRPRRDARPRHRRLPRGNGELRLLVVAEVNIRNVTTTTLSHSGYRVIAPATGGGSNPP